MIMSAVNLGTEGSICHFSCQCIILIPCHIIGRVSYILCIKQILIIEEYPEVISEGQLIQFPVNRYLVGCTCIFA